MTELLELAWQNVVQTASYLFAYCYVLVLAPAVHLTLVALAPGRRWTAPSGDAPGHLAAALLGISEPLSRRALGDNLSRLTTAPACITYLAVSHGLSAYAWILLGPLLGKDFLLSHVIGIGLFTAIAGALARLFRIPAAQSAPAPEAEPAHGALRRISAGLLRFVGLAALGLGLGGLVAAWGFSATTWAAAEIGAGGAGTQTVNALLGLGLALLGVPPVANLFVGTYLWKVGLAHAGIVAFFCAAPAAPTRWRLYASRFGRRGVRRLVALLLASALLAGLATAALFAATDIEIRYKLIPQQMWQVR